MSTWQHSCAQIKTAELISYQKIYTVDVQEAYSNNANRSEEKAAIFERQRYCHDSGPEGAFHQMDQGSEVPGECRKMSTAVFTKVYDVHLRIGFLDLPVDKGIIVAIIPANNIDFSCMTSNGKSLYNSKLAFFILLHKACWQFFSLFRN